MNADAVRRELSDALSASWPDGVPFREYWRRAEEWLAFHAPHVGDGLMRKLITECVAVALLAERNGTPPVAPVVGEAVRKVWEDAQGATAPRPETHFVAPFSGPRPEALRRARRSLVQNDLNFGGVAAGKNKNGENK